jgi:hypothetical protein
VFFTPAECVPSPLVARLGCELTEKGIAQEFGVDRERRHRALGGGHHGELDPSRGVAGDEQARDVGAMAAFAVNTELLREDTR